MRFERMILGTSILAVAIAASPAPAAMDAQDAIGVCSRINKKDARLECYDQVARDTASGTLPARSAAPGGASGWSAPPPPPMAAPAGSPSWAAPPPPQSQPQAAAPQGGFGAERPRRDSDGSGPDEIQAQVVSAKDNGLGQWQVTLSDGAIWRMTERVAMFRPPAPNEAVKIRKGALGGFLMEVGKQSSVRVMRVR